MATTTLSPSASCPSTAFHDSLEDKGGAPALFDPEGKSRTVAARLQRSKTLTKYGTRLNSFYLHYSDKLKTMPGRLAEFKRDLDPHKGRVDVEKDDSLHIFHSIDTASDTLRTFDEGHAVFGLDIAESRALAAAAATF